MLSSDGQHLRGWITRHNVLHALAERVESSTQDAERGQLAAEFSEEEAASQLHLPRTPLEGYEIVEVSIRADSPALGRHLGEVPWPSGSIVVAASEHRELVAPRNDIELHSGERVILLTPIGESGRSMIRRVVFVLRVIGTSFRHSVAVVVSAVVCTCR